ncbi:MAG: hypothetical protein ACOC83_01140 [Gemmatimonadota bacterium]
MVATFHPDRPPDTSASETGGRSRPGPVRLAGLLAAALVCLGSPTAAQLAPPDTPLGLELGLQAGVFSPAGDLVAAREGETFGSVGATRSPALGATAGLRLPGGLVLEAQGLWVPDADMENDDGVRYGDMGVLGLSAVGLYRPSLAGVDAFVQPFVGGGAGIRRYSFDPSVLPEPEGDRITQPAELGLEGDETDFTLELVAGAWVTLLPGFRIRLEARDYLSGRTRDDASELQNDLIFLAGTGVALP